jgi:predicted MFS family arabinose efflux permease
MSTSKSLFALPNYPAWFGADTFLLAGSAVHWIVMSVLAYQLSGSVTVAGWFATARGLASSITQAVGGTFVDRHDHRKLILAQAGSCCILWATMGTLFMTGHLSFVVFASCSLTSSAIFGFLGGTTNAALIRVVGPKRYPEAESINQGRDAAVNTAGSPLGAVLFGINQAFPFFASAICDAIAFVSALFLNLPDDDVKPKEGETTLSFVADTLEGWRWVFTSKRIVSAMFVIGCMEFGSFATYQAVNLTLVEQGTDPLLLSLANVGRAIGIVVGSAISTRICNRVPVGKGAVAILSLVALSYLPMFVSSSYLAVIVSTCLAALPMPLFSALVNGFVFSKTPIRRQGRTRAAIATAIMLFGSTSGAVAGELLPRIGFAGFVALMAGLALFGALFAAGNPLIRRIGPSETWPEIEL